MRQLTQMVVLATLGFGFMGAAIPGEAAWQDPPQGAAEPADQSFAGLPLRQQMFRMQVALSRVMTDVGVESLVPETLASIEESQRRMIEAKIATPPRFGDLDEAAQLKHDRAYRAILANLLSELARLEMAVLEGSEDRALASLAKLQELQQEGHNAFQRPRGSQDTKPEIELDDEVTLTTRQLSVYVGVYEFAGIGFRVRVIDRDGAMFLETFGQDSQRLYSLGDHRFKIAISVGAEVRFDVDDASVSQAIIFDPGGGRPSQRVDRVR